MKKKCLYVLFLCVTVFSSLFFSSCDSLWKVSEGTTVSFKIDINNGLAEFQPRTIDGTEKLETTISLYRSNTSLPFASKTIVLDGLLEKIEVTFNNIQSGSRIYATMVIKDGSDIIFNGRSDLISVRPNTDNVLVIKEVTDDDDTLPVKSEYFYVSSIGKDDTGDGTIDAPWASMQKAVDHIIDSNDEETRYVIIVSGEIIDEGTSGKGANGYDDAMVEIEVLDDSKLNLVIEGDSNNAGIINAGAVFTTTVEYAEYWGTTVDINVTEDGLRKRVIYVEGSNVLVTLGSNLTIKGGIPLTNEHPGVDDPWGGATEYPHKVFYGGGLYVHDAQVIMDGAIVSLNVATHHDGESADYYGGGICIDRGVLTMNSGHITNNASKNYGGGVIVIGDGEFILNGTSNDSLISNNESESASAVYLEYERYDDFTGSILSPTFTMNGGIITKHYVNDVVNVGENSVFNFFGGTISDNTIGSEYLHEVIVIGQGEINLKGNPIIKDNMRVLPGVTDTIANLGFDTLNIVGALTGSENGTIRVRAESSTVARGVGHTITENDLEKFIDDYGSKAFLNKTENTIELPTTLYVSTGGDDEDNFGTESFPWASVQKAVNYVQEVNDTESAYTIIITGTITNEGSGKMPDDPMVKIDDFSDLTLTIKGDPNNPGIITSEGRDGKTLLYVEYNLPGGAMSHITLGDDLTLTGATLSGAAHVAHLYTSQGNRVNKIFTIDGTTIEDNTLGTGYAVYAENVTLNLQGNTTIWDNKDGSDSQRNVSTVHTGNYTEAGRILITEPLTGGFVGITPVNISEGETAAEAGRVIQGEYPNPTHAVEDSSVNLADYNVNAKIVSDNDTSYYFTVGTSTDEYKLIVNQR